MKIKCLTIERFVRNSLRCEGESKQADFGAVIRRDNFYGIMKCKITLLDFKL
jgi:hypothetical protein